MAMDRDITDDSDEEIVVDEDESQLLWPECYDDSCEGSSECCEGTKCLPKMAEMDPNISESGYCIIGDCVVGDSSTCPPVHTCIQSTMGTYCVKD